MRFFHTLFAVASGWLLSITAAAAAAEQRIHEPDEGAEIMDGFGAAIAMDGEWAVVGAPRDDSATVADEGAAYVLKRTAGVWAVQTKLHPQLPGVTCQRFGYHVAMRGDMMAVSARSSTFSSSGRVFLYRLSGEVWSLEKVFSETGGNESFGAAVTLQPEAVTIGMPLFGGVVICHNLVHGVWRRGQVISPPGGLASQGAFGTALATEGDVLLIGCPGLENNSTFLGRVYEHRLSSGVWTQSREIQAAPAVQGNRFGLSVKMAGGRALVGASGRRVLASVTGLGAYFYQVAPTGWTLLWSQTSPENVSVQSPEALALSDTRILMTAGRGVRQVLIPAIIPGGSWAASTLAGTVVPASYTMTSVAVGGDQALAGWQGKVTLTFVPDSTAGDDEGQVWPLAGSPSPTVGLPVKPAPTRAQVGSWFGEKAVIEGDVAVVGAHGYRNATGTQVGCAYILERQAGVWQIVQVLDRPAGSPSYASSFGQRFAVSGSWVYVCDPLLGRVFGYQRQSDGWPATPTFSFQPPPVPSYSTSRAVAVAASGDMLAVTVDSDATDTNYVHLFRISEGQPIPTGQVIERDVNFSDNSSTFGLSIALKGSTLAITDNARLHAAGRLRGEVSVYDLSGGGTRLVSVLTPPVMPRVHDSLDSFGREVLLSESLLVTGRPYQLGDWPMPFQPGSAGYLPTEPLPRPVDASGQPANGPSMALHGDQLFVSAFHQSDSWAVTRKMGLLYVWRQGKWVLVRELTPGVPGSTILPVVRALSADTVLHTLRPDEGSRVALSFMATQQVVAFDGPPLEPLTVQEGQLMDLGMLRDGQFITLPVRIQNQGGTPLQLSHFRLPPPADDIFSVSFTPGVVAPGEGSIAQITFEPVGEGYHEQAVEVLGEEGAVVLRFRLGYHTVSDFPPPEISLPAAALFRAGEPLGVHPEVNVPRNATFRWLRDGRVLPGQTGRILYFAAADKAHAGRYRLEVSQPDGSRTSAEISIGIYEAVVQEVWARENQALSFTARVWGPGVQVRWNLKDTWAVRGTQTPTLSILRADQVVPAFLPQLAVLATVSLGGEVSAVCHRSLLSLRSPPVLRTDLPRRLIVGQEVAASVSDMGNAGATGISGLAVSARGLPPGLSFDGEFITGMPQRTGTYRVTFTGRNLAAEALPLVRDVTVLPAGTALGTDFGQPQSYATLLTLPLPPGTPDPATSPGLITLRTTSGAGFSGTLRAGAAQRSFSGRWIPSEDGSPQRQAEVVLYSFLGYRQVILRMDQEFVSITASLSLVHFPDFSDIQHTNAEPLWPQLVPFDNQRAALGGRFNVLARSPDGGYGVPRGFAIASVHVGADMTGVMAGTLPEGSGISSSTPIVDVYGSPALLIYSADARNVVSGFLSYQAGAESPDFPGHWLGELYWSKKASPGSRLYPEAIHQLLLQTQGTRYFIPSGRPLLQGSAAAGGSVELTTAENPEAQMGNLVVPLRFTAAHRVVFEAPNPQKHQMSVYPPTGFFTGSFVLDDPVPGSETRRQKRTVNYRGLITHPFGSDVTAGGGFFLLPQLTDPTAGPPVTPANAPIHSIPVFLSVPP